MFAFPLLLVCFTALLTPSHQYDPCVYVSGVTEYVVSTNVNETYWTVPANVHKLCVMLWAAGGGGGASHTGYNTYRGGGGGSGAFGELTMAVAPGDSCVINVGIGGMGGDGENGGVGNHGEQGGSTSITCGNNPLTEVGGGYGGMSATSDGYGPGGAPGVTPNSGLNVAIVGNYGQTGGKGGTQVNIPFYIPSILQVTAGGGGDGSGNGYGGGGTSGVFLILYQTDDISTIGTTSTTTSTTSTTSTSSTTTGPEPDTEKIEISPTIAALFGTVGLAFFIIIVLLLGMLICVVRAARRNPEGYTPVSTNISTNESHEAGSVL